MARLDVTAQIDIDDENLDKKVIEAAAAQLLSQLSMTARYGGTVVDMINDKLSEIVAARVEAMLDREITQVDRFGDAVPGPKKTFRDVFADTAEKFLESRVDNQGRPTTDSFYSKNTRLEYLLSSLGLSKMETECRKVAEQFKAQLQARATQAITAVVAEHVKKAG